MKTDVRPATTQHGSPYSLLSLFSGWVQQGVESLFATQRILIEVAMRQNATAMNNLRDRISDPDHSPMTILTELAVEATSSFTDAQRVLLNLVQEENEIFSNTLKEQVGGSAPAVAMTDLVRRSVDTFIEAQQRFLTIATKHSTSWLENGRAGKGYGGDHMVEMAREAMDNFVHAQKKFLDVLAEETTNATSGDHKKGVKKTELPAFARQATHAFIDAQKKLLDIIGQQMNVNLKAARQGAEVITPVRLLPIADITNESVRGFVDAEKALIDSMTKPRNVKMAPPRHAKTAPARRKKTARARKSAMARAAHA